ncbi:uncharacterized protein LOC106661700 [Cimex lectularius]|uniref:Uncharacterized protein n=1 Tax=Cimex lectularius TaxID=79782 RepID=A0A8I6R8Z1_CIMLE|nr:uncharacterized protein LOC106661700 [Cimex lectularius]
MFLYLNEKGGSKASITSLPSSPSSANAPKLDLRCCSAKAGVTLSAAKPWRRFTGVPLLRAKGRNSLKRRRQLCTTSIWKICPTPTPAGPSDICKPGTWSEICTKPTVE